MNDLEDFIDSFGIPIFIVVVIIAMFFVIYRADSIAMRKLDILEKNGCATVVVESNK